MPPVRAAFLDRDGVLVRSFTRHGHPHPPATIADLELLPGVVEACTALRAAGIRLVCVTNQPDIARGITSAVTITSQNELLQELLGLDAVLVCPHDDDAGCSCRKPRPGLLLEGAARFGIDLRASVMVGDRWRDIEAGQNAGCRTVFVDCRYAEPKPRAPDLIVGSLLEAMPWIVRTAAFDDG